MNTLQKQKWQSHVDAWAAHDLDLQISKAQRFLVYSITFVWRSTFIRDIGFISHSDLMLAAVNISAESIYTDDSHGRLYYCY